jgi:hypothetical protein
VRAIFVMAAVLVSVPALHAQSTFGAIAGAVRDSSGGAVEGAALTLRNIEEGTTLQTSSISTGLYEFFNVKPGLYVVFAERLGFAAVKTPVIRLRARETRRAELVLQVASRSDSAVVSAVIPLINIESGTLSDSKSGAEVAQLPLNYRATSNNLLTAMRTVPGVQQDASGRLSIGGGLPGQVEASIDGISIIDVGANMIQLGVLQAFGATPPSAEIVGELKVTSANNSAEFGQMRDITLVTRSGSNEWHGGVFWYHQNRALDATIYRASIKAPKVFHVLGGSFSGPVRWPGQLRKLRPTFFFADFEGVRRPRSVLNQLSVPTAEARNGALNGVPGGAALDPLSGLRFPDNRIPASRISTVTSKLFGRYYPLPTASGISSGINHVALARTDDNANAYDLRLDHELDARQRLFARWSAKSGTALTNNRLLPGSTVDSRFRNLVLSHVFAPRGTVSIESRLGFTRISSVERFPFQGREVIADLGLTGLNPTGAGDLGGFPGFFFDGSVGYEGTGRWRSDNSQSSAFQSANTWNWIRRDHSVKFGADLRRVADRKTLHNGGYYDDWGAFEFDGGAFSGNAFADLLLGLPAYSYYASLGPDTRQSAWNFGFFAQDRWRVNSRLTLEAGLRWELRPPFREDAGNMTNFDHNTGNVIIPDNAIPAAASFLAAINACPATAPQHPCTSVLPALQFGLGPGLRRTYYGNWNPRLSLAWQPTGDGKTVLRGGVGRYTQTLLGFFAWAPTGIHSSDIRTFSNFRGPQLPPWFAFPAATPPLSSLGDIATEDFNAGVDPSFKDPRSWQWNFTLERELGLNSSMRATYLGVQSTGMPVLADFNQVAASTIAYSPRSKPFQQWAGLFSEEGIGFSNYQGLQLEWSRRAQGGLFWQASYVLAKNLGAAGTATRPNFPAEYGAAPVTDRFNSRYDRGNLSGSRRHRVLVTALLPLPFGKGRHFGGNWNGLPQAAMGGWELSTVSLIESGPYQTPTISAFQDVSNTNIGGRYVSARPDRIGDGNLPNPTPGRFYDLSAFPAAPRGAGRFGNAGAGILRGPGTIAISAGLSKTFRLSEKLRLRAEATFTNLPNHPNFLPPNVTVNSPLFGILTAVQSAEGAGNRTGQLGIRLDF